METQVYEIKKNRKWETVRATSMKAINDYCENNGYTDFRMAGMFSISETKLNKNLTIVA